MNTELIEPDEELDHAVDNIVTRAELLKRGSPDGKGLTKRDERLLSNARMVWLMSVMQKINAQLPAVLAHPTVQKQLLRIPHSHETIGEVSLSLYSPLPESKEIFPATLCLVLQAPVGPAPFIWFYTATGKSSVFRKIEPPEFREVKEASFWGFWDLPLIALSTQIGLARVIAKRSVQMIKER